MTGTPTMTATTQATNRPAATHLNAILRVENKLKVEQLLTDHIERLPSGGTLEFRRSVDELTDRLMFITDYSDKALNKLFSQLNGELSQIRIKISSNLTEEERREREENMRYREAALNLAKTGLSLFSVPSVKPWTSENKLFNAEIERAATLASIDTYNALAVYARFLTEKLLDPSQEWNTVNLTTALNHLNRIDSRWFARSWAHSLAPALIDKIATLADKHVFNGFALSNLVERTPSILSYLSRLNPKDPLREKRLLGALGKALDNLQELPEQAYAEKSFLYPLREIYSPGLSREGGIALCTYVAKLNHLFSQVPFASPLSGVAATFHAMHGISSWAYSDHSDAMLVRVLTNLNDRLQSARQQINSIEVGSIMYGLCGLDLHELSPEATTQAARTIRLLAEKLDTAPSDFLLNSKSLSSVIHGLTVALEIKEGAIARAVSGLVTVVENRLPAQIKDFCELGEFCGALVTLHPHRDNYPSLTTRLVEGVLLAAEQSLPFDRNGTQDNIAWQTVQQAYALYDLNPSISLELKLDLLSDTASQGSIPSPSEERLREWVKEYPGTVLSGSRFVDGFELDILVEPNINIEIDGAQHGRPTERINDRNRDNYLSTKPYPGLKVYRIPNGASKDQLLTILKEALPTPERG